MPLRGAVYLNIIASLKNDRAEIDRAITVISRLAQKKTHPKHTQKVRKPADTAMKKKNKDPITNQILTDLTVVEAAEKYLHIISTPQTTRQIEAALRKGGLKSEAKNFQSNLFQMMKRKHLIFNKTGPGLWGLVEWKGGHIK